jgi:hypothetical protein
MEGLCGATRAHFMCCMQAAGRGQQQRAHFSCVSPTLLLSRTQSAFRGWHCWTLAMKTSTFSASCWGRGDALHIESSGPAVGCVNAQLQPLLLCLPSGPAWSCCCPARCVSATVHTQLLRFIPDADRCCPCGGPWLQQRQPFNTSQYLCACVTAGPVVVVKPPLSSLLAMFMLLCSPPVST